MDRLCAAKELMMLGFCTPEDYIREGGVIKDPVPRRRSARLAGQEDASLPENYWSEGGEAPEYGISFIAGFTEGGAPFGLTYTEYDPDPESAWAPEPDSCFEPTSPGHSLGMDQDEPIPSSLCESTGGGTGTSSGRR